MDGKDADDEKARLTAKGFVTVSEAAKFLGLSRASLYKFMESGQLAYAKVGKSRRVPRVALTEFAARSLVPDKASPSP